MRRHIVLCLLPLYIASFFGRFEGWIYKARYHAVVTGYLTYGTMYSLISLIVPAWAMIQWRPPQILDKFEVYKMNTPSLDGHSLLLMSGSHWLAFSGGSFRPVITFRAAFFRGHLCRPLHLHSMTRFVIISSTATRLMCDRNLESLILYNRLLLSSCISGNADFLKAKESDFGR